MRKVLLYSYDQWENFLLFFLFYYLQDYIKAEVGAKSNFGDDGELNKKISRILSQVKYPSIDGSDCYCRLIMAS